MHKQKLSAELLIFAITFGLIANAFVLGVVHAQITIPVQGADVSATGSNGFGSTVSDSQGHYVITTFLDSGTYSVTASAQGYVRTTVNNVAVTAGAETSNVNILMPVSGAISGKVTDASSGSPIQYAYVTAYNASGTSQSGSTALTDANGNYQIITNLDTGTYNVTVQNTTNHLSNTVSGVSVTAGSTTANVNFALAASGIIAGTVTDSASLAPLSSIIIEAIDVNGNAACVGHTDSTGNYSLNNSLPTGTYNVTALLPAGHLLKTVAGVAITAGSTTTVNLALTPSGIISGKVTSSSGQPVSGAFITASFGGFVDYATSDSNGNYRITDGLPTGSYTVTASSGLTFNQVTGVSVVQGAETSNVNIVLAIPLSGTITGRVTNSTGRPIQYATVDAQSLTSSGSASTDANGNYAITGLATDSYNVTASATGFVSASEDSIPVTVNTVTADVNFQLAAIASGIISGTVTSELVDTAPPSITDVTQTPSAGSVSPQDTVQVNATVTDDASGVKEVTLSYASNNGAWTNVTMSNLLENMWSASIPAFPYGTNVTCIIIAQDKAGNAITTLGTAYEHQYVVIPEFPTLTVVLPSVMVSTLLAVALHRRRQPKH